MSATRDAPEVVVRGILKDNWTAANTSSITPDIHHGWLNTENNHAEITISNPNEDAVDGGDTGYSSLAQDGEPVREVNGTLDVNIWSNYDRTSGVNPRKFAHEAKGEIERIIKEHYDAPTSADLTFFSVLGASRTVEPDEEPTMFRYLLRVGYGYRD